LSATYSNDTVLGMTSIRDILDGIIADHDGIIADHDGTIEALQRYISSERR